MSKTFKKLISFLLVAIFIISSLSSLAIAKAKEEINRDCPHIYVRGFMADYIYTDKDDPDSEAVYPMNSDGILELVESCVPALLKFSVTQNWDTLIDDILPICNDFLKDWFNDPDGTAAGNSGAHFVYPSPFEICSGERISFRYDWRGDPIEIASDLNDFINYVCEVSGSDQVSISCHSLGGIITLSYLSIYGNEKVKGVAFDTTAIFGETYTGELLCGNVDITGDSLISYLRFAFEGNEYDNLINGIFDILQAAGLADFVEDIGDTLVEKLLPRAYPEIIAPLFAGWPTIWAMTPDEYIDEAMTFVFDEVYKDSETDRSGLIEKIERYNELVREHKTETLLNLDEVAKVGVISRYGYSSIPATPVWQNMSDGVVDSKNTSFGATTALYGETFSAEYLSGKDEEYISPDLTLDASTCLFPEKTWFIKSLKHSDETDEVEQLIDLILYSENEITVDTYKEFPRFMIRDYDADKIVTDEKTEKQESVLDILRNFFLNLIKFIRQISE